jgi:N-acetylglucosaminyl-diphospho-decaprenol L-rhamnosyltransferase
MRLDFVVVAYRSSAELAGCLASISADAPPGSAVVVVDNASPDDSATVARSHPARPRIVVSPTNRGFAAGCNLGAASSQAAALFFLNPDARLTPGATATLIAALEADPSVGVAAPRVVDPTGESLAASAGAEPSLRSSLGHFLALGRVPGLRRLFRPAFLADGRLRGRPDWVSAAAMLVRREAFEAVGGFDERLFMYMEDVDLCRRLRARGWAIAYEPGAIVEHVMGHSQSTDQPARWYAAYHTYVAAHHGSMRARAASFAAGLGMGLRAVACRGRRPAHSARMVRGARAAFRFVVAPPRAAELERLPEGPEHGAPPKHGAPPRAARRA